jgi:hypothetical protein
VSTPAISPGSPIGPTASSWFASPLQPTVLFESTDRRDLEALKSAFQVKRPETQLHCCCIGEPHILLYANGREIARLSSHHARSVRCGIWKSDAPIADVQAFLRWFDERGMPTVRTDYEQDRQREKQSQEDRRRWEQAMPSALAALWSSTNLVDPDTAALRDAPAGSMPQQQDQILALLSWYGSGVGLWSGFPAYEDVPGKVLLAYTTADLLAAIDGREPTTAQTEGVARLFGSWDFSRNRAGELRLLPSELKARLLAHAMATGDEDKRSRAQRAFGDLRDTAH